MPTDTFIVPPSDTLGVWCDVRQLEDYPDVRLRRGPPPRAVVACRNVALAWYADGVQHDEATLTGLRMARKQILEFGRVAVALEVRRSRRARVPAAAVAMAPEPATAEPVPSASAVPVTPAAQPAVPQDEFTAALTAVFG